MRILLDENFPLPLVRKLQDEGLEVEHIILLGLRTPDAAIIERLNSEELLFFNARSGVSCSPTGRRS
jgi:hypothetical protein